MPNLPYYPTVVVSDIHLGTSHSKTYEVSEFLRSIRCDLLIMNGDIIDGWHLKKSGMGKWKKKHTKFFKTIMKMMEKYNTKIVYIRGNHDDFLDNLMPLHFANIEVVTEWTYENFGKRYYVCHGDVFDSITTKMKWLAQLGDTGYTFLLWVNKVYNQNRLKRGLPYYSLSQKIKNKVKGAINYITDFESEIVSLAKHKQCDGVICGHIHHPDNKMCGDVHYLNSGDWVESLSALIQDELGEWQVVYYDGMLKEQIKEEASTLAEQLDLQNNAPPAPTHSMSETRTAELDESPL